MDHEASRMGVYVTNSVGRVRGRASASAVASHPSAVAAVVAVGANLVHVCQALAAAAAAGQGGGRAVAAARGRTGGTVGTVGRGARGAGLGLERVWRGPVGSVGLQLQQTRGVLGARHEQGRQRTEGQQRMGGV
ncbi:hypothetical protein JQN64_26820 [Escherichia coli]|nr:hypothetical protein [Escherichia coli]